MSERSEKLLPLKPATEKARRFTAWAMDGIKLLHQAEYIDEELRQYQSMADEYDGDDFVATYAAEASLRRREIAARLAGYRVTMAEMIRDMDLSGYAPRTAYDIRRVAT